MNRLSNFKLWQRLFVLGVLTAALVSVSYTDFGNKASARADSCEPCISCRPDTTCYPCGAGARATDNFCEDGLRMFSCAGVCKPPGGGTCAGDMPICEGTAIAICNGGTWECDDSPYNQCTSGQPYCPNGAFCYGGEWYCANGSGCSGIPPTCPDGSTAACHSGQWYCNY